MPYTALQIYVEGLKRASDRVTRFYESNINNETPLDKIRFDDLRWYRARIQTCIKRIETVDEEKAASLRHWLKNENRYLLSFNEDEVSGSYDALVLSKNLMRSMNEFLTEIRFG